MRRIHIILIFACIIISMAGAYWLLNRPERIPPDVIDREFRKPVLLPKETGLYLEFYRLMLNNESDRAATLVVENKFQFQSVFDFLLQQGVYHLFSNKSDSAKLKFGAAFEIAEIFSKKVEDNFHKEQYEFISSLKGSQIYQKLLIDMHYNCGKKRSLEGSNASIINARSHFKKSLKLSQKIGDQKKVIDNLVQLQFLLYSEGFHHKALESGYDVLKLARKIGYRYRECWTLFGISTTQINTSQYYQALTNATRVLIIAKELNDYQAIMSSLERITVANRRLGNFKKAIEANDESLRYSKLLNSVSDQIKNYINYGTIYCNQGDYAKSKDNFQFAFQLAHDHHDYNESTALENLGELYRILGDHEQALDYNLRALELNIATKNGYRIAGTKKYIGDIYKDQKKYAEALIYYQEAISLLKSKDEESSPLRLADDIWLCVGDVQKLSSDCTGALESYLLGLEGFEKANNPEGIINSMTRIGNLYRELKEFQQALRYLRDAIKMARNHQDPMLLCYAYFGAGLLYRDQGILNSAVEAFSNAIQEIEKVRKKIYYEQEKINYFANVQELYEEMILTQFAATDFKSAFNFSERSRARALFDQYSGMSEIFSNQSNLAKVNGATIDTASSLSLPPCIQELQLKLDDNIQIIEYKITAKKLLIFLVTRDNLRICQSEISREAINDLVFNFRNVIGADSEQQFRKRVSVDAKDIYDQSTLLSKELYTHLIAPVANFLDPEQVLYIVPDELLFYLPFGALVSGEEGEPRYLIEDYDIAYTPSAAILANNLEHREPNIPLDQCNVLAVGNPTGDLKWSEYELTKIAELFAKSKLLLRNELTKAKFIETAKKSYHIIHIATHAVINEKSPLYSYFIFGGDGKQNTHGEELTRDGVRSQNIDNILMAHEIFNFNFADTRLVSLSACQTGCGKIFSGEGVVGLSRAFMKAGASSIISTLWKIDDRYSSKITESFYREWKTKNLTKVKALRIAQLNLLNEIKNDRSITYPHPYIWAGFTISGDYK